MLKRSLIVLATACLAVLGIVSTGNAKTSASGTFKDGPYTATTPDSSTCGNNWAQDLFVRNFVVHLPPVGGVYTVTEKFQKGHFSTFAGSSPAGCDTHPGGTVNEGIQGTFSGTFTMSVTPGAGGFNSGGSCEKTTYDGWSQCDTAGWVHGFFGDDATYDIPNFHFSYKASGQGLTQTHWVNADTGNSGDISNN
jgi:hypothetical protein